MTRDDDRAVDSSASAADLRSWPLASRTRALMRRFGLHAVKSRGQNFLVEDHVAERIVDAVRPQSVDGIVEVGAGLGALTVPLVATGRPIVAYEVDRGLVAALEWLLGDLGNLTIRSEDFLKADLGGLGGGETGPAGGSWAAVGNLPYYITTPLLEKLLVGGRCFERVVVTMQTEVAERILAAPGTGEYGQLTVFCRFHCSTVERLCRIGPGAFLPRPEVTSTALVLAPRVAPPPEISDAEVFFAVVRAAFGYRRKTLGRALWTGLGGRRAGGLGVPPSKSRAVDGRDARSTNSVAAAILAALSQAGIDPERRAETLSFAEFAALSNAFVEAWHH